LPSKNNSQPPFISDKDEVDDAAAQEQKLLSSLRVSLQGLNVMLSSIHNDLEATAVNFEKLSEMNGGWELFFEGKSATAK